MYMYFFLLLSFQDSDIQEILDSDLEELCMVVPLFYKLTSSSDASSDEKKAASLKPKSFYGKPKPKPERKWNLYFDFDVAILHWHSHVFSLFFIYFQGCGDGGGVFQFFFSYL